MAAADPLRAAWERGRAAWPDLVVPLDRFVAQAGDANAAALVPEDLYLACACADGDPRAFAAFEERFVAPLGGFLAAKVRDADRRDEVLQTLRVKVLGPDRAIAGYRGRGRLVRWLQVAASRIHVSLLRGERPAEPLEDDHAAALLLPDAVALRKEHRDALADAFRAAIAALPSRDRALLRYCYVEGLSTQDLGALYGVNKGTISRWLSAARERLRDDVVARAAAATGARADEVESLLAVVASALELSLPGLLASVRA